AIAIMLGQCSGTLVSKALAQRNQDEASEHVSTAFFTGITVGSVIMVVGLVFLKPFMRFLGSTETILPYAMEYGFWVLVAAPFMVASFVLNNNLRYEGKAFYAMIALASGGVLNVFLDFYFIKVVRLGVFGAGMATAISQAISFVILYIYHVKMAQATISRSYISRRLGEYLFIMKVGFPALIRQGLASVSIGVLNNLTKIHGDAAIAAMSVVNRFSSFVMCVGLGIGQGFQPVAAFNYQAGEYKRVKKGLVFTMATGFIFISCLALPGYIFAEDIVYMFQKSQAVVDIGSYALRWSCFGVVFLSLSVPVNMLYQSIRKVALSSFLSMLRNGLLLIPLLLITTEFMGLKGIQLSQPIADISTGLISVPFILYFLKKTPDVAEENQNLP
ncbi:MAG: MATE family efflux transporter, partial [Lachnospiraceae bacterium]|nr:MATE family efflux transporter [Lachnospiraceae bacterium]